MRRFNDAAVNACQERIEHIAVNMAQHCACRTAGMSASGGKRTFRMLDPASVKGDTMRPRSIAIIASTIFATMITGSCSDEKRANGEPSGNVNMIEGSNGDGSSADNVARYRQRFEEARKNPSLVRGRLIGDVSVDCKKYQVRDLRAGNDLTYAGPRGTDAGAIWLSTPRNSQHLAIQIEAEPLVSDNGLEKIFKLSRVSYFSGGRRHRGTLSKEQLQYLADLLETLQNSCKARREHWTAYVLYD